MLKVDLDLQADVGIIQMFGNGADLLPGIIREVRQALDSKARTVLIDMSGVNFINADGITAIADTINYARKREAKVFLTDIRPSVQRIISLNLKGSMLPKFNTKREALREIGFSRLDEYIPQKYNIVVVENDTSVSTELSNHFKENRLWYSYKIRTSPICPALHELVKQFQPSLIVISSHISTENGVQFLKWLKSDFYYWCIPVIIATNEGMVKKAVHLIENGADDLVLLPLRDWELHVRLQFAIQMYNIIKRERERLVAESESPDHL